ncbi:spore germination protein [Paenibacillus alginolyticus]|uniref:Spore germination protein n=1 Tax=Paenibacillus alginolyticus TaxID=59839 RepID=A0ABT4GCD9_9BACL|nr:spore germination protein [Paenibacillus alginolyticus]MCY9693835.1 spore germination protein [Paenibacillus alginolyticus]MEC0148170.1 spore germination protein [Paenibacillus alginolyticus]
MQKQNDETMISGNLHQDETRFRAIFDRCDDIVFRSFLIFGNNEGLLVFMDGMADEKRIDTELLQPLMSCSQPEEEWIDDALSYLNYKVLPSEKIEIQTHEDQAAEAVLDGDVLILVDGAPGALSIGMTSLKTRSVEEPATEPVIRGPRDGFTESLQINVTLIRRRLRTPKLKSESLQVGALSRTKIVVMYVEGIAQQKIIDEVMARIQKIRLDMVLESGYIEELIMDNRFSIFPQLLTTERPDRVTASLAEGRVAIIVDNTPFSLIAPATFFEMLQSAEDYNQHYIVASATRWLRLWLSFSALVFPSLYIAITTMHQEMLPESLLLSIASSREAVPFPAIVEAFLMELAFEGLREAGIRLPRPVGQAVSIVGALVIGQAAVQAGLVSASLVIVVSFTGIASFIFPSYSLGLSIRYLRFPLMIIAGTLGLYGILIALLAVLVHLSKLRTFGEPYFAPASPINLRGLKDALLRVPWWKRAKTRQTPTE